MPEGYGSALGRLSKWLDPLFDQRKRLERELHAIEQKIEVERRKPASDEQSISLSRLLIDLGRVRSNIARLKD